MYSLGRFLQLVGLLILPAAMAGETLDRFGQRTMFVMAGVGILVFFAGWMIQQRGKR